MLLNLILMVSVGWEIIKPSLGLPGWPGDLAGTLFALVALVFFLTLELSFLRKDVDRLRARLEPRESTGLTQGGQES